MVGSWDLTSCLSVIPPSPLADTDNGSLLAENMFSLPEFYDTEIQQSSSLMNQKGEIVIITFNSLLHFSKFNFSILFNES